MKLLTLKAAKDLLGISWAGIQYLVITGKLKTIQVGKVRRTTQRWIEELTPDKMPFAELTKISAKGNTFISPTNIRRFSYANKFQED